MGSVADLTLSELEPYINGKVFTGKSNVTRCSEEVLQKFLDMLEEDGIAKDFFKTYETPKHFFTTMPDFAHFIPKEQQVECFYSAKIGGKIYKGIPSACVYLLQKAYEEAKEIPNLIPKIIPVNVLNEWFKEDYFGGGITLRDVICNVCNTKYKPLSNVYLKNPVDGFTEVYIPSEDMVAALPNNIAESLDGDSIKNIELKTNGLTVNGILLRTMCNYVGAVNSYYDLRQLI